MNDRNLTLLPPNSTALERSLDLSQNRITNLPVGDIRKLWNAWDCPVQFLPALAWQVSVDYWDPNWSEFVQRQVIDAAFRIHRIKGTTGAIKLAVDSVNADSTVTEWDRYGGDAYHYRLEVSLSDRGITEEELISLRAVALNAQNERSVLDGFDVSISSKSKGPKFAATTLAGTILSIFPLQITDLESETDPLPVPAAGAYFAQTVTIEPEQP
ncbi:phage tail protein I [Kiloniella sp. b19]|uniref:phage tail protein I n=1 Tax=Kiloniella sp. GXU_MW_B19 TaxID=3141326 RepID=UPI0031D5EFFB